MLTSRTRKCLFTAALLPLLTAFAGCDLAVHEDRAVFHRGWDRDRDVYYVEPRTVYVPPPREVIVRPETPRYYGRDW